MEYPRRNAIRLVYAVVSVMLCGGAAARGGLVIDEFSDVSSPSPWPVSTTSLGELAVLETGLSGVIGGTRLTTLSADFFDLLGFDDVGTNIVPAAGQLDYTSSVGADGDLRILYAGGFTADFSGDALIQIDFTGFDLGAETPMPVTVTLWQGATSASLTRVLTEPGPRSVAFDFVEFANIDAIDVGSVDAMLFEFDPGTGGDFRIGRIGSVVPEPTTLVLLLAGAAAIVGRRRDAR